MIYNSSAFVIFKCIDRLSYIEYKNRFIIIIQSIFNEKQWYKREGQEKNDDHLTDYLKLITYRWLMQGEI